MVDKRFVMRGPDQIFYDCDLLTKNNWILHSDKGMCNTSKINFRNSSIDNGIKIGS